MKDEIRKIIARHARFPWRFTGASHNGVYMKVRATICGHKWAIANVPYTGEADRAEAMQLATDLAEYPTVLSELERLDRSIKALETCFNYGRTTGGKSMQEMFDAIRKGEEL